MRHVGQASHNQRTWGGRLEHLMTNRANSRNDGTRDLNSAWRGSSGISSLQRGAAYSPMPPT